MDYQKDNRESVLEWPFPVDYDAVHHVEVDVLCIGGGIIGGTAGIAATKRGMKVAVVDKAPIKRSGSGGAGLDHYNHINNNPRSPVFPDEYMAMGRTAGKLGHAEYIQLMGTWDHLLELEEWGLPIRDEDDDFAGAPTRDEETKILKAYDYKNMLNVKLRGGQYIKPVIYHEMKKVGVEFFERITVTSLLLEGGKCGQRVVGATAFHLETGEFYVFHAKSIILSTGSIQGLWQFSTELTGTSYRHDPNCMGDGFAMAWLAGAETLGMSKSGQTKLAHPFAWPRFGVGNPYNTWFPCSIVDNNGKEIPWQDMYGDPVTTVDARNMPVRDQPYIAMDAGGTATVLGTIMPKLVYDLPERIRRGEFELPFWADLPGMPEHERYSIWGMMVGNEGKTRYTMFDLYTRGGFNPDKDMLQAPVMAAEGYASGGWFQGEPEGARTWRSEYMGGIGGLSADWNLMTAVPGLFLGGSNGAGGGASGGAVGKYVGNRAAEYAARVTLGEVDEAQLAAERERVYAPIKRAGDPGAYVSWKELWAGSARVMQQHCIAKENMSIPILQHGLKWLESIKKTEMQKTFARNPHELARVIECEHRITNSEVVMRACIAMFEEEAKGLSKEYTHMFNRLVDGEFTTTYKKDKYWLEPPYAPTYKENYDRCRAAEEEVYG